MWTRVISPSNLREASYFSTITMLNYLMLNEQERLAHGTYYTPYTRFMITHKFMYIIYLAYLILIDLKKFTIRNLLKIDKNLKFVVVFFIKLYYNTINIIPVFMQ